VTRRFHAIMPAMQDGTTRARLDPAGAERFPTLRRRLGVSSRCRPIEATELRKHASASPTSATDHSGGKRA
jgi:hypothetical protein